LNSTTPMVRGLMATSAALMAAGPSTSSDSANSGTMGTRLPQTTNDSMSICPAFLEAILATPQKNAASTTMSKGTRAVISMRSMAITPIPAMATSAPIACMWPSFSPRNSMASAIVKNAWIWMMSEARPAGMPSLMAENSNPNWAKPMASP
jgi:hypothetical protein